ncbi:MAG: AI-2E family transporter [Verrucomicrobiota bacterium]
MRQPSRFQQQTLWNAFTGLAILTIGALAVGAVWLLGKVFGFLQPVLVPLLVAGIVAYLLDPVVRLLQKRGMSRLWAVISVFILCFAAVALLVASIIPGLVRGKQQVREMVTSSTPTAASAPGKKEETGMSAALTAELNKLAANHRDAPIGWMLAEMDDAGDEVKRTRGDRDLESFSRSRGGRTLFEYKGAILDTTRNWVKTGSTKILGFLGFMLGLIMVPIYLFFFLKDSASIRARWHDYVPLRASPFKTEFVSTVQEINGYLVSFFRGQVLVAAIDGILVGIALTAFGLPYGFLIGVFMAVLGIIPYIGSLLCLIPACIIGYLHAKTGEAAFGMGPWAYVACVVGIFVVVQQINSILTTPKIVGDSVGLHPLTVIFSMLFWSLVLGGFVGTLLAVPLTAAIKVLFRRFVWERQKRYVPTPEKSDWSPTPEDDEMIHVAEP